MPKSKDAFRTISEVAEWLETPAHVLRFWESKFTQVKPVKRAGGRRYYRPADMQLLGGIKKLLHDDGLTIKGAQKLLREHGVKHIAALSQPLDDDLLDDDVLQEAAFEPDAQPENEPAATVLSFPNRSEPAEDVATMTPPTPEPGLTPSAEPVSAQGETQEFVASHETTDHSTDTPAFGSDALPAFLRRAPSPQSTPDAPPEATAPVNGEAKDTAPARSEKLTIDPVARFEPVETPEPAQSVEVETPKAAPRFVHHEPEPEQETPAQVAIVDHPPEEAPVIETAPATDAPAPVAVPIVIDVPSIAKIAPELDSFTAPTGVLSALSGARRISPELAGQLSEHLSQLRALRERMQNH